MVTRVRPESSMKTRQFLVVFPLVISLLGFGISFPLESFHTADLMDTHLPEISKDYFPALADSALVASKSKPGISLWHPRLFLQFVCWIHCSKTYFCSAKMIPLSPISLVVFSTVMRC